MPIHHTDREKRADAFRLSLNQLAMRLGRTPTEREYKTFAHSEPSTPSISKVRYDYGTWTSAVIDAGLIPAPNAPPRNEIDESQLIEEFVAIANDLGRMPPLETFRQRSRQRSSISNVPYQRRWGKWSEVIRHFETAHGHRFNFELQGVVINEHDLVSVKLLGLDLPMTNEPSNEMETIALFMLLAVDLGYKIVSIGAAFPDALVEKDGRPIKVEFEYLTSNYLSHCHPRSDQITCVCWRVDRDISPVKAISLEEEVIQRRKALASLGGSIHHRGNYREV